ncbi:glycosyltransferase [Ilumatobacter nonamiensis]|uniref:glycosyltransferase n=1 Tax=Ilumatobacter nonamiensis TaxID=467093 RepID=UPI0009FF3CE0|nr:glycosyltransferase [Ilumatobacter nonamiensis]
MTPRIHSIVVTYRRPTVLRATLAAIDAQQVRPDHIVVVDNDSAGEATSDLDEPENVTYLRAAENLGPAGGIAVGMHRVLENADDEDLVLLIDDDDPPPSSDSIARVLAIMADAGPDVAAAGLVGARFDRRRALTRRVPDRELVGRVDVDYIAGGQFPMYRVGAIRDVGVFDAQLFFGFEELEFGLRLRSAGYRLLVDGDAMLALRRAHGRTGIGARAQATPRPPWRRYYSSRNIVEISRRYGLRGAVVLSVLHAGPMAAVRGLLRFRDTRLAAAALRGTADGVRGRLGRVDVP